MVVHQTKGMDTMAEFLHAFLKKKINAIPFFIGVEVVYNLYVSRLWTLIICA
ncbi:MAG: hypothetical protein WAW61_05435 [Methylococcaceae bacterium]